jgi:putative restriction endonuclease
MPALAPEQLTRAIIEAITSSGYSGNIVSPTRRQPRRFIISGPSSPLALSVYAWTLTFGGRPSLRNEYRIQMTSVESPLEIARDGFTILIGYEPTHNLFAGFDLQRHRTFTTGSPSVQMDIAELRRAEGEGLSFHRKTNDEIAVGIRPDMFMAYATNAAILHRAGRDAGVLRLLNLAAENRPLPPQAIESLSADRQRVITTVSKLTREAGFRRRVLFAYGNRCAVTRVQLQLVDAAHIMPVGSPGSVDHVRNGLALSPTYHRAFDAGLIYLNANYEMRLNRGKIAALRAMNLAMGVDTFTAPLGPIFLPPDPQQHPSPEFIRNANRVRQISV